MKVKDLAEYYRKFEKQHGAWLKKLLAMPYDSENVSSQVEVMTAAAEQMTWRLSIAGRPKVFLHSRYDPVKEANKWADEQGITLGDRILTYGVGVGYHVAALLERIGPNGELLLVETNPGLMKLSLEQTDWEPILAHPALKIILVESPDLFARELSRILSVLLEQNGKLAIFPSMLHTIPAENDQIRELLNDSRLTLLNMQYHAEQLSERLKQNYRELVTRPSADQWDGRLKGIPCTLISAGPSLKLALPHLQEFQKRSLIFVVGTALQAVLSAGIKPDVVVLADPEKKILKQLPRDCSELLLLSLPTVHPDVLARFSRKIFAWNHGIEELEQMGAKYKKSLYHTGGSVSTLLLDVALRWKGDPLILIGQDLAYSEQGATHADQTMYEGVNADLSQAISIGGVYDSRVYTSRSWRTFLRWIERRLEKAGETRVWNTSTMGARIQGTREVSIEYILRELPSSPLVDKWRTQLDAESRLV